MKNRCIILCVCLVFLSSNAIAVNTHIQTDDTLTGIDEFSINAPGSGQLHTLSEINGKIADDNLFYSFSDFNIGTSDTVSFNLSTPSLTNVISRITGGFASLIDGQLKLINVGSNPSFFLINPAGITFTSGASVDVPGSFYVSTASGLNFSDGSQWTVSNSHNGSLSAANPESFGFLGDESGSIKIGSLDADRTKLAFQPGTNVTLVGNQIQLAEAEVINADTSQSGINLQVIATGSETTKIGLSTLLIDQTAFGDLSIQNSKLKASGNGSGYLGMQSDNMLILNSQLFVDNTGDIPMTDWHGVKMTAQSEMVINNSWITNDALGLAHAGKVTLNARDFIKLLDGSIVSASAFSSGNAGSVFVQAGQLEMNELGSQSSSYIISQAAEGNGNAGQVSVTTTGLLKISEGGSINASTFAQGDAGRVIVNAGQLEINAHNSEMRASIASQTAQGSTGNSGEVLVTVPGLLKLLDGGSIDTATFSSKNAGKVIVNAGQLEIDEHGANLSTSISSQATDKSTGNAGEVFVSVTGLLKLLGGGTIDSFTFSSGNAGIVTVNAGQLEIDAQGPQTATGATGILSRATGKGLGDSGTVLVTVQGLLRILEGGEISSSTLAKGNAGTVTVKAGSIEVDGKNFIRGFTGISSRGYEGHGGNVSVTTTDSLKLLNQGTIDTSTFASGNAGTVTVHAKSLEIDGHGEKGLAGILSQSIGDNSGHAGDVFVTVPGLLKLLGSGSIGTTTTSIGHAGNITVNVGQLEMYGLSAIQSDAFHGSGNAGKVSLIVADLLRMSDLSSISTSTSTSGTAGKVSINAGRLNMDKSAIMSQAGIDSSGQTGSIEIAIRDDIVMNNAFISISNSANVDETILFNLIPTDIKINTAHLHLTNSSITTQSNGNTNAGNINIHFSEQLFLGPSQITTEAFNGNGGDITITGDGTAFLLDSAITTSVSGQSGNGGDISIAAQGLILNSGFIRANTAASGASGGDITIRTPALIPSGNLLFVGGNTPFQFQPLSGLNVIQAAAPDGVSGTVNVTTPQLNLNAILTNLAIESFDNSALNRDMCEVSESSSLLQSGRGAQPLRARDLLLSPMF